MLSNVLDEIADAIQANPEIIAPTGSAVRLDEYGSRVDSNELRPFDPTHTYCFYGINLVFADEEADDWAVDKAVSRSAGMSQGDIVSAVETRQVDGRDLVPYYRMAAETARQEGK